MEEHLKQDAATDWQAKADEYLAGWKRAMADYQNREKELARERQDFAGFVREQLLLDFLPVLDNLRQAVAFIPDGVRSQPWAQGVGRIVQQFEEALRQHGVTSFSAAGTPFDPSRHEAVGEEDGAPGAVIREQAVGYERGGKVLRPAKVIVGKAST